MEQLESRNCWFQITLTALKLLLKIKPIPLPSIITGVFGYPIMQASKISLNEVRNFLEINPLAQMVSFVCFSSGNLFLYKSQLQ